MKVVTKIILAIIEFIVYTYLMVLVGSIEIDSSIISLILHFASLTIISFILYYLLRFILRKLKFYAKKDIYQVCLYNIGVGIFFPIVLIILIPNESFTTFAMLMIVSTGYYGIFVNILISIWNYFLTNRRIK